MLTTTLILLCLGSVLGSGFRLGRTTRSGFLPPPQVPEGTKLPPDQWFTQSLDHFNPRDNRTWRQRYFSNATFYKSGGPVLLMIGGEGPANPKWMVEGSWVHYGQSLNAYLLYLEHRYYGKSHPTQDASVENLEYLSSEQALADLASFTVAMKEQLGLEGSRWVAVGGSYPGSLAAWYRLKFPHLVHAAVATSAPVLAQVNFKEYLEVVGASLALWGEECNNALYQANKELHLLLTETTGLQIITKQFRLCSPMDPMKRLDVANFFSVLAGNVEEVVQYNEDNRDFEGIQGTNITIDTVCTIMTNVTLGLPYARYAALNSLILDTQEQKCLDHTYKTMIEEQQATSWENNTNIAGRSWMYQTCTEFGFYQTSESSNQPFGNAFSLQFFTQQCKDIFGPKFTTKLLADGIERTNMMYGGRNLKVTRVVFPNGSIDPWHVLGITTDLGPDAPAIFINGTAHCANMYPSSPRDLPQLKEARHKILGLISRWLQE